MRMLILGGTGKTGVELLDLALAHGHDVTAFVRSPHKIIRAEPKLTVVPGDPRSTDALAEALRAHEVVMSALGPRPLEALTRTTLLQECIAATLTGMARADVRRLIVISSAMLFPSRSPEYVLSRLILRPHFRDLQAMEMRVRASPLEWTLVRPPRLVNGRDEAFVADASGAAPRRSLLSYRALAAYMVDAAEHAHHRRAVVAVSR